MSSTISSSAMAPIEGLAQHLQNRHLAAIDPLAVDDIKTLAVLRDEVRDHFGRILTVDVDEHVDVGFAVLQSELQRPLVAHVTAQGEYIGFRMPRPYDVDGRQRPVGRGVVEEYDEDTVTRPQPLDHRLEPVEKQGNASFLVVYGHQDRQGPSLR